MQSLSWLTLFLCCAWAASILYGEMVAYWLPLWACSWPRVGPQQGLSSNFSSFSSSTINTESNKKVQVNVAVLADPQLMDRTSLGLAPKSFALEAAQFYTDIYMRRAFLASIQPFKPDIVLFLGDQFDGGPFLSDEEWQESLYRFKHIFDLREEEKHSDFKAYYLSGNHDIGYSSLHSLYPKVISRYEEAFGERNYRFTIQNVEFIVVDAQTLDGPMQGKLTLNSWKFVENISKETASNPRVLLTHIPLYRPNEMPCGPYRSTPIINQRISYADVDQGIRYQNYLSEETSRRLMDLIRPVLVLSGHDHDQCTITHSTPAGPVIEHTLGTVSWQQGNLYPSFMLLSASASSPSNSSNQGDTISTQLCFLPMQTHIYIWYIILFIITLLLLTFWPTSGLGCRHLIDHIKGGIISSFSTIKEKDEDENCDYEMVWDAEGSMHLVKKASSSVPHIASSEIGMMGRGGVTARLQARKQTSQDTTDSSITVDMNATDNTGRDRLSKSKITKIIQRLFRVLRLLTIITAVNLPLYMMLLFKDSIDR